MTISTISAGPSASAAAFPNVGLSMLFMVTVGELPLGGWTSCEGLKVEFKHDKVRSGGENGYDYVLPVGLVYPDITLKRAMETRASATVQGWLSTMAAMWTDFPDRPIGTMVMIRLLDVYKRQEAPVATWVLQQAYPVSWTGPSLNAKSNEVAMETLTIAHQGFLLESM